MQELRRHQKECLVAIDKHFEAENSRALIKMFCGAGKSYIIYNTLLKHGGNLSVVVVPSINLITQFNTDYLIKFAEHSKHEYTTLTVCSKDEIGTKGVEFTTDPDEILEFLESEDDEHKIVLITYQSLETLFNIIEEYEMTIDLICFDEAHHVTAEGTQELLFGSATDEYSDERYGFIDSNITKSLFFTATPINKNGICMFNLENHITIGDIDYEFQDTLDVNECSSEEPHCGDMIYEYMLLDGVNDNVLNDFDIRVDLYTEEGDISIFEAISRTILETGNSRVLTFHSRSEVASEKGSSVIAFYNEGNKKLFKKAFEWVLQAEYPQKKDYYKKITLTGITGSTKNRTKNRTKILDVFDKSPDDEIYLLGSCETIGEGVDTKNANMCVFVDPKQSYVKIIQNIGRICRKQLIKRNGTVLIPARVNVEKYKDCGGDPVARDKVIREEMSKTGDFNGILNCLSALRQEDPYMFELCLKYPDVYTKKELKDNFRKNGMVLDETEYSGKELFKDLGVEYNPKVSEKGNFNMLSRKLGTNIQVSNQKILEEDLYIDKGCERTTHFVKTEDDKYMKVMEDKKYIEKREKRMERPHRNAKPFVHSNPDIQVLWGFTSDIDVGKSVFGGYIEADVVVDNEEKAMEKAKAIVERANLRVLNSGRLLPRGIKKNNQTNEELVQENKDNTSLGHWKTRKCYDSIIKYLDKNLTGWRDRRYSEEILLDKAKDIVERANSRVVNGEKLLPRNIPKHKRNNEELVQEDKDASCLENLKTRKPYDGIIKYLDEHLAGWQDKCHSEEILLDKAKGVVKRANLRESNGGKLLPREFKKDIQLTNELIQETKDSCLLRHWKIITCYNHLNKYLNENLPGWRDERHSEEILLDKAKCLVKRANLRVLNGDKLLPRQIKKHNQINDELIQEQKDAISLNNWKKKTCYNNLNKYLDENLNGWRVDLEEETMKNANAIVDRANLRVSNGGRLLPRNIPKHNQSDDELIQENKDASSLRRWKTEKRYESVIKYLDENLAGWRDTKSSGPVPKSTTIKPKIKTIDEPKETEVQRVQRQQSEYQELTKKMATQNSETTNQMFTTNPSLWHKYHDSRDFSFKGYDKPDEIPLNKIIKYLETKKNHKLNILDLGCGRNLIQEHFKDNKKFTVTGYDYVSYNGSKVADISHLPEEDENINICVYSQSLMGSNWKEYLREGYRVLVYNSEMIISESVERYEIVKHQLAAIGMHVIREEYSETQRWFYIYAIKQ